MNIDAQFQETGTEFDADFGDVVVLKGDKGDKGDPGYSPVKGVDYLTESDKEEIRKGLETNRNRKAIKFNIEKQLSDGHEVVLEIEVQGAMQVRQKMKDAVFIFIAPPTMQTLKNRLNRRGTEPPEVIQERYEKACREVELAHMYDYIVVNDTVENAADKIMAIIRAEHAKTRRTITEYMKMVEEK